MRDESTKGGKLFLLGGENVRFLVEEPVRMAFEGFEVISLESESVCDKVIASEVTTLTPVCLIVGTESLKENVAAWINNIRGKFPWLPIVILDQGNSRSSEYDSLPQLVESVAVIQHPCTQKSVIDAIENSIWWSKNLCRMRDRVSNFASLTERELAIVSMATDGVPNKSMARRLEVSIKTIEKNRRSAYEKLKIASSAEMAALVTFRRYFNRSIESSRTVNPASVWSNIHMPSSMPTHSLE
jgi:DNA-binding CsgD family transcriptional regulator